MGIPVKLNNIKKYIFKTTKCIILLMFIKILTLIIIIIIIIIMSTTKNENIVKTFKYIPVNDTKQNICYSTR